MKKILLAVLAVAIGFMFVSSQAFAISKEYLRKGVQVEQGGKDAAPYKDPAQKDAEGYEKGDFHKKVKITDFPENGWHKGPYVTANIGMMQVTNDNHSVTNRKFNGTFDLEYGISFGWDIADWIGPLMQINFATTTDSVGDPNNAAAAVVYNGFSFPAGTFPVESGARQYALDFGIFAKATLPYFVRASWQPKMVKIIPFAKLGGAAHAVFNKATTAANMAGAFGGGPAVGLGCELIIWKGFFFALDATEYLIFQKAMSKTIANVTNVADGTTADRTFTITSGGFKPHFSLMGMFGWHF